MRALLVVAALALTSCVHVQAEPALPFPERPPLNFFLQEGNVCLTPTDTEALRKFILKLNEYEAARDRLIGQ